MSLTHIQHFATFVHRCKMLIINKGKNAPPPKQGHLWDANIVILATCASITFPICIHFMVFYIGDHRRLCSSSYDMVLFGGGVVHFLWGGVK
jgi:hypothetical protein